MLGHKLKNSRISAGLSLRGLQDKIGNKVSAQAIGKYERGEMQPSPDILKVLARELGVSENYLVASGEIRLSEIEFRENFIRSKKEEAQVEATILKHIEKYIYVEELLQMDTIEWDEPQDCPFQITDIKEAEWIAHKVRDDWKLGNDPIVKLSEFIEDRGIKIIFHDLPDSISGVTCFVYREDQTKVPVILINKRINGERQRFTIAHELGHLLVEKENSNLDIEKICHRFAGAFLMPNRILWDTLGRHRRSISIGELISLKELLGVSIQAIVYRCKDLGIISYSTYQELYKEFAQRGWLKPPYEEPFSLPPEGTERFKRLCFRALAEDAIPIEKVADFLNQSIDHIQLEMEGLLSCKSQDQL